MMSTDAEWKWRRLDELGFVGRGKSRHRPRNDARLYGGPYPFIQTAEIMAADPYITNHTQTYTEFGLQQSKLWPPNTLCMTIAGANTAKTAILKFEACFPDSVVGFIPKQEEADLHFVKYSLDLLKDRFLAVSRGATQDNLSLDKLLSFPIPTPTLQVQKRIAGIISAYDDLIENNLRRIKILEEVARVLYHEWFVSFRPPSDAPISNMNSALGPTSKNWKTMAFSSLVDFAKGRKPKQTRKVPLPNDVKLLLIDALRGGEALFTSPDKLVIAESHDTLMVMDGGSSCDVTRGFAGVVGSTLGRFRAKEPDYFSPHAIYLFLASKAEELKLKNVGAAIPHANKDYILNQTVVVPPRTLMARFDTQVSPIHNFIEISKTRIQNLRRTRDLMLPRLLSGRLGI